MVRPLNLLAFFIALIVSGVPLCLPADASAQGLPIRPPTAEEILQQTLTKFDASVAAADSRIDDLVDRAVFRIERAASKGASQDSLQKAAAKAAKSLPPVARKALAQINRDLGKAMIRMRTASGYEREMQEELEFRREQAIASLEDAIEDGIEAINEAVAESLAQN